jgi:hypothetical protein
VRIEVIAIGSGSSRLNSPYGVFATIVRSFAVADVGDRVECG